MAVREAHVLINRAGDYLLHTMSIDEKDVETKHMAFVALGMAIDNDRQFQTGNMDAGDAAARLMQQGLRIAKVEIKLIEIDEAFDGFV